MPTLRYWNWDLAGEAFGDSAPNQDADGDGIAFVFDMRFPGQRYDSATGMSYNYFRDYEPGTGRYSQSDPIGLNGGVSTYGYAKSAPMIFSDIFGLKPGDCYKTADIAAANALYDVLARSISENREYGGWIYKTENGWYSYTTPQQGGRSSISLNNESRTAVGKYHTHGGYDVEFDSENFSRPDLALKWKETSYLGTPTWILKKYTNSSTTKPLQLIPPPARSNADACKCGLTNDYESLWSSFKRIFTGNK